ncbi:flavodoxin [Vibrio sp. Vb5031]|uniref:flavodoxin n=1 Tax=Vibrio TaxID=662 RepID=UPI001BD62FBC|nr:MULTISPECIES: flavodoxin [Vibrio]ELA8467577.1 flavodoxin [Vibrio alginolyticus]MBS9973261.1 flavodoxin [Vibrio alginolyticus]MBT0019430.1 flavodoxin [Vibrio alginolyticus]MDW1505276.1 flavodoxin [Vibrio sp. Vb5031]MDW1855052.1 flavodoxin [Vibrio sp. Vb0974]
MNEQQLASIERKNTWLYELVEVEFPTPESLKGRDVYFKTLEKATYQVVNKDTLLESDSEFNPDDIFLVDFHRLTIMFSILQSQRWEQQYDKDMIIEYLTQIILTPDFELYIGFKSGVSIGAAIVSHLEGNTLISDVAVSESKYKSSFVADLAKRLSTEQKLLDSVVIEN